MSEDETDEQEAAIIRKVYGRAYSHAESILHRLANYQRQMPHREAVARLYLEVMESEGGTAGGGPTTQPRDVC